MGLAFNGLTPGEVPGIVNRNVSLYFASGDPASGRYSKTYTPISTSFSYTLTMAAKYVDDILQMYEQNYALFYPVLAIDMPLDELNLSDANMNKWHIKPRSFRGPDLSPFGQSDDQLYWTTTIDFDVRGWIFKYQDPDSTVGRIHTVSATHYPRAQDGVVTSAQDVVVASATPSAISAFYDLPISAQSVMINETAIDVDITHYPTGAPSG